MGFPLTKKRHQTVFIYEVGISNSCKESENWVLLFRNNDEVNFVHKMGL